MEQAIRAAAADSAIHPMNEQSDARKWCSQKNQAEREQGRQAQEYNAQIIRISVSFSGCFTNFNNG